ncbi:transcription termination/antitermination protein NusG [Christensenellaceae bacterium]|nr:transcription termination/antitermination protein NusG [Christensenellaceae bacterium]BDF60537.1 transcription termination/antitermination protein NusG [Christensenellaceae bacterium]
MNKEITESGDKLEKTPEDMDINNTQAEEKAPEASGESVKPEKDEKPKFLKQEKTDKPYWYVVYTYSGYENKVMDNLLKTVENHNLHDTIIDVKVPMEESVEVKNGKKRHVTRKMFPGYVMVKMFLTDESWYVVRNTRGVTGFVGPSSKPIPLSDAEVRSMGIENVRIELDVEVGNNVIVTSGPLESFVGVVEEVNAERQKVRVLVSMFGRDTSVELDFVQVKRI